MADWFGRWRRRKSAGDGVVGVEVRRDGIALVHRCGSARQPEIRVREFRGGPDANAQEELARAVRTHGLQGTRCVAVLPSHAYGLRLLDAPDVEPEELRAAVPWLVKDLIDFPLEEAVVDYFQVPDRPGGQSRIQVVTARRSVLEELTKSLEAAGLELAVVEVAELALRTLAERLPEQEQGLALLRLEAGGGLLTMNRGGHCYLARGIETGLDALRAGPAPMPSPPPEMNELELEADTNEAFDLLTLEIQRSLDYYESQLGPTPIAQLAVAPLQAPVPDLVPFLEKNLSTGVRSFGLDDLGLALCDGPVEAADESQILHALGAALRCAPGDEPEGSA